jgi:hypothetical protein
MAPVDGRSVDGRSNVGSGDRQRIAPSAAAPRRAFVLPTFSSAHESSSTIHRGTRPAGWCHAPLPVAFRSPLSAQAENRGAPLLTERIQNGGLHLPVAQDKVKTNGFA